MLYAAALAIAVGLGVPIAAFGAALGQGKAAAAALEGIARQPDAVGDIRSTLILSLALIESLAIYALLVFFMLFGKLPGVLEIMGQAANTVGH
jgi:F-type H+-transporting ATPase subunit c